MFGAAKLFLLLGLLLAYLPTKSAASEEKNKIKTTDCHVSGLETAVQCVQMLLPLDWQKPEGKKITVTAVIISALSSHSDSDPIVILAGGPGQAASDFGEFATSIFRKIHKNKDIILFDLRGTGLSTPLICPQGEEDAEINTSEQRQQELLKECLASFDVDVRHFTSYDQIQDMEAFRTYMGYSQFNFWGGSFGTRIAQHYIHFYPNNVRSAIMDGAISSGHNLIESFPVSSDYALNILFENCKNDKNCNDAFPHFKVDFLKMQKDFSVKNIKISFTDPVSWTAHRLKTSDSIFTNLIRGPLYNAKSQSMLPFVVDQAVNFKNYNPFIALVSGFSSSTNGIAMGSMLSVLCAEDAVKVDKERLMALSKKSMTRGSAAKAFIKICKLWPTKKIPEKITQHVKSTVPILVLSGRLDPVTPPHLGQEVADNFINSKHIIAYNNSHISSGYSCMPAILNKFFADLDVKNIDTKCLDHVKLPPFAVGFGGPVALQKPSSTGGKE